MEKILKTIDVNNVGLDIYSGPIGISCSEEKTIIIVTKPKKDRKAIFFQLLTWNKSDFLATYAKTNKMGNE